MARHPALDDRGLPRLAGERARAPASVAEATESYFADQDLLGAWMEENCRVDQANPHLKATSKELFDSYAAFARAGNEPTGSERSFVQALDKRGFTPIKNVPTTTGKRARGSRGSRSGCPRQRSTRMSEALEALRGALSRLCLTRVRAARDPEGPPQAPHLLGGRRRANVPGRCMLTPPPGQGTVFGRWPSVGRAAPRGVA